MGLWASAFHALPPPPVPGLDLAGAALRGRIARATSGCLAARVWMRRETLHSSTICGSSTSHLVHVHWIPQLVPAYSRIASGYGREARALGISQRPALSRADAGARPVTPTPSATFGCMGARAIFPQ